jgi:putative DNA primase/helicase
MTYRNSTYRNSSLLAVNADGIMPALKGRRQFVGWRLEERNGRLTKVPYIPGTQHHASVTDLVTWRSFEEALAAYDAGMHDGIGFAFCSADPFVGIDLDGCRDPETGALEEWAETEIARFKRGHVEMSPSGRGVHIITRGKLPGGTKHERREIYGQDRFFTLTGVAL